MWSADSITVEEGQLMDAGTYQTICLQKTDEISKYNITKSFNKVIIHTTNLRTARFIFFPTQEKQ